MDVCGRMDMRGDIPDTVPIRPHCDCVDLPMHKESNRLKTFKNWPLKYICEKELAKNGFFYIGDGDRVLCNFCKIGLEQWETTDIVEQEHQKWSPKCPFLLGHQTNNVPIIDEDYIYYMR